MKNLLSVIVVIAFSLCMVNVCSAERVLIRHEYNRGEYTGVDLFIETSGIATFRIQNTRKNVVRHGKEWGEPQYALVVPVEEVDVKTGKIKSGLYGNTRCIFFKANDGNWCFGTIGNASQDLHYRYVKIHGGDLLYRTGKNISYLKDFVDIFEKASKYIDVDSIPNTEAEQCDHPNYRYKFPERTTYKK